MRARINVLQRDVSDCGVACLASVASHYRLDFPLNKIRQFAGTGKQGTTIAGMLHAAECLHFRAKAFKGNTAGLPSIPLPAIALVHLTGGLHHYLVIYRIAADKLRVMDPAHGKLLTIRNSDFASQWSGIVVLMTPDDNFKKGSFKTAPIMRLSGILYPHRRQLLLAFVAAAVYVLLGFSTSIFVQKIADFVLVNNNNRLLNTMGSLMLIMTSVQIFIGYMKSILGLQTGRRIDKELIMGYYRHLLRLPLSFFDSMRTGEIVSRVNDAVRIRIFINDSVLNIAVNTLIVGFSFFFVLMFNWKLSIFLVLCTPLFIILYWLINRVNRKWQRELMNQSAALESEMVASIGSIHTIKCFSLERYFTNRIQVNFMRLLNSSYKGNYHSISLNTVTEYLCHLQTIAILWIGSRFVLQGQLTVGGLLSIYTVAGYFSGPLLSLLGSNRGMQEAMIAADRLFDIIDLEPANDLNDTTARNDPASTDILFSNINFAYPGCPALFSEFELSVRTRCRTAIIGQSGSGKSTLFMLLMKLYPPASGSIKIGGVDIRHINNERYRKLIACLPQKVDLFAGTIIDNIAPGDNNPDMKKIRMLATLLGLHEFIGKLPGNYYSLIADQGTNLSGGQKQRIAVARALYREPEILLLDEPSSSLDPESEAQLFQALDWFHAQGKTLLIISHKPETIRYCDEIILLHNGKICEMSDHELLRAKSGRNCATRKDNDQFRS